MRPTDRMPGTRKLRGLPAAAADTSRTTPWFATEARR